ncbi:MAG: CAAD domain-containing protein, partial [Cyanobacteria bacterium J06659_2]
LVVASAAIAVRLTLAILGALNGIPLLPALLELIGLGYTAWFVYRYLWRAANRQELVENFNSLKDQVLGNKA